MPEPGLVVQQIYRQPMDALVSKSGSNLNLSWLAQRGVSYRAQFKTNLTDATWLNVSGDVTATNASASKTDSTLSNAARRFYRVQLLQ